MQQDPLSHGLWEESAPAVRHMPQLTGTARADVAVIGAGYTGLAAALHLAEAGADVVVLEAARIGFGGSGRNVGLVNAGLWVMPDDLEATLGPAHGRALIELLGHGPAEVWDMVARHGIACEAVQQGTLHCAHGRAGLRALEARAEQWQRRGAPVQLLDRAEATRRIGSDRYTGALFDPRAGTIQPLAYTRGLANAASDAGARIFCQSQVTAAQPVAGGWRLETDQGSLTAEQVIVATNAYTQSPWPEIRAEITHLPYFNFATEPLSAEQRARILPGGEGCWDTREVLTSFRLDAAGRLVLGSVGALSGTGMAVHLAWARRSLKRLFPELGAVHFESAWYGMIGMTTDAMPRFHRLAPGVTTICGFNGRGIAPGTVFGRLLAGLALGRITEADIPLPLTDPAATPRRAATEAWYRLGAQLFHTVDARL